MNGVALIGIITRPAGESAHRQRVDITTQDRHRFLQMFGADLHS